MRKVLIILFTLFCFNASATNYYFANAGSDANAGTQASPYQTITKLNTLTLIAGDSVLFKRGDTFYGSIRISVYNSSPTPITIKPYGPGAGALPIISGFASVTSWSNLGSNIWESTSAVSTLSSLNIVQINGKNTPVGRYPNTGYLYYESYNSNISITDNELPASPDWTGATVVMRKAAWVMDKSPITSQSGGTITYSGGGYSGNAGKGYFIQNDSRTLDTTNEWYYNPSTKKIRIYSTSTPSNVQVPTVDTLVYINGSLKIVLDSLNLIGANKNIVLNDDRSRLTVQNCNISYAGINAIQNTTYGDSTCDSFIVKNNVIDQSNNGGIVQGQNIDYPFCLISGNKVTNTFPFPGSSLSGDAFSHPIGIEASRSHIIYNVADSMGGYGISFRSKAGYNSVTEKNLISNYGIITQDVAGIYIAHATSGIIQNNFVFNGRPDQYGLTIADGAGVNAIYVDYSSSNVTVINNTTKNTDYSGIRFTNANIITIKNNIILDATTSLSNWQFDNTGDPNIPYTSGVNNMSNSNITGNILVSTQATPTSAGKFFLIEKQIVGDSTAWGNIDSNNIYYFNGDSARLFKYQISKGAMHTTDPNVFTSIIKSLSGWRTAFHYDTHTRIQPQIVSDTSQVDFFYNSDTVAKTIPLPYKYIDMKGVSNNTGSVILQPFTSTVLVQNGALIGPPTVNAGSDQPITTDTTTLTGTVTPASGQTITSTVWSKTSGATAGITGAGSLSASVSGLTSGTYIFRLTANQSDGQSAYDEMQVDVNIPPVITPIPNQTIKISGNIKFINQ